MLFTVFSCFFISFRFALQQWTVWEFNARDMPALWKNIIWQQRRGYPGRELAAVWERWRRSPTKMGVYTCCHFEDVCWQKWRTSQCSCKTTEGMVFNFVMILILSRKLQKYMVMILDQHLIYSLITKGQITEYFH